MNFEDIKIGFIGCGHMASAIIKGIIDAKFVDSKNVFASEISEEFAQKKEKELGIKVFTNNVELVKVSDVIFLATKPNVLKDAIGQIKDFVDEKTLVISIAAGVSTNKIESAFGFKLPVIRVMPNGPAMILEGMSGIVKGNFASDEDVTFVEKLLSNIGKCLVVEEEKIDVLTAISGSGPAFFYKTIHEMALAGEKLGLDYEKSLLLAAQTAIGSAKLMLQSPQTPEELINGISTKGGCTEVGVNYMDEQKTDKLFFELIQKTAQKANELGK